MENKTVEIKIILILIYIILMNNVQNVMKILTLMINYQKNLLVVKIKLKFNNNFYYFLYRKYLFYLRLF